MFDWKCLTWKKFTIEIKDLVGGASKRRKQVIEGGVTDDQKKMGRA